jgi:hypothetical protein
MITTKIVNGVPDTRIEDIYALKKHNELYSSLPGIREAAKYICDEIDFIRGNGVLFTVDEAITFLNAISHSRILYLEAQAYNENVSIHHAYNFHPVKTPHYIQNITLYEDFIRSVSRDYPSKQTPTDVLSLIMRKVWTERPSSFQAFCLGVTAEFISTPDVFYRSAKPTLTLQDIREYCISRIHIIDSSSTIDSEKKTEAMHAFIFVLGTFHV